MADAPPPLAAPPPRAPLSPRLRLLRFPLAGTTLTDVWAGWLCAGHPLGPRIACVHLASLALYFAGMTLNDVFDAERDRTLAPTRPIPSGAISRRDAAIQGALLLGAGVLFAWLGGRVLEGALLALAVLGYNGLLKRWRVPGALAMGLCRALDVLLGAGLVTAVVRGDWWPPAGAPPGILCGGFEIRQAVLFPPALALFGYVAALTLVSTLEDDPRFDPARMRVLTKRLLLGIFFVNAASLALYGCYAAAAASVLLAASFPLLAKVAGPPAPKVRART